MPLTNEPISPLGGDPKLHAKSYDVKCLRCGVMNIPDNRVCGNCGASLPLIYDSDGNYMLGPKNPSLALRLTHNQPRRPVSPGQVGWFLRVGIVVLAIIAVYLILHHK